MTDSDEEIRKGIGDELGEDAPLSDSNYHSLADRNPNGLWRRAKAYKKRRSKRRHGAWWYVAVGGAAICILGAIAQYSEKSAPRGVRSSARLRSLDAEQALSHGNGYDWGSLSDKARVEVGILCEERTGRHHVWTYVTFIDTFYTKARSDNQELLERRISELCAVAAAMDIEEE